jgi:hypothetical protein
LLVSIPASILYALMAATAGGGDDPFFNLSLLLAIFSLICVAIILPFVKHIDSKKLKQLPPEEQGAYEHNASKRRAFTFLSIFSFFLLMYILGNIIGDLAVFQCVSDCSLLDDLRELLGFLLWGTVYVFVYFQIMFANALLLGLYFLARHYLKAR